jgi:hypothetical protein
MRKPLAGKSILFFQAGSITHYLLRIFVQIFQDDLADCPGSRRGAKILAVNPQWQTTIQQGLMW